MSFSFGSTTGAQNTSFGGASKPNFSFGSTNTATTSTAGFAGFGTATSSSAGQGFGAFGAATSTASPFGTIGAPPASSAPLFGAGFGSTAAKPATAFGTSGAFGTNTSLGAGTAFGTGTAFGSTAPAFGSTAPAFGSTAPAFGSTAPAFGANTLGANTFGTTGFGTKPAISGFGGFGTALGATNTFGQQPLQQQQQQPQGPQSAQEALVAAVFNCSVFGDERDQVMAKWNLIQAQWGTGKAYYSQNAPPLELNEQNPLCKFKAVGYTKLCSRGEKDGHVALVFNKPEQEIKTNKQQLINSLFSLLGNKPNLAVNIESIEVTSDNKTQVVIYVVDKNLGGTHVPASELGGFLGGAGPRAALAGAGCGAVSALTRPPPQALTQYLLTPPPGIDARMWKQAQADNPDPENYIPVPIIGFSQIKFRASCQAKQASLQGVWLKQASSQLAELRTRRAAVVARLASLAATHHALRHTLLQVISRQEMVGRVGSSLSAAEEAARARLHELAAQLAAPPLHNGRLNELLCAVRLQRSASAGASHERYHLDPSAQEDLKQFLVLQQRGMAHLLDTARKDLSALNTIADGMNSLVRA